MVTDTPNDVLVVLCTVPEGEASEALAELLVGERLAACVNLLPAVRSVYRWEDAIESDDERLLVIKTSRARFEALRARLAEAHPYDVPEILALSVERGHGPYLDWVLASTGDGG